MSGSNPRRANGHRRDRLRRRVLAAYTDCALCGLPVDKTLHYLDPGAPEVDELIPVSLGGDPLAWSNVQLAHRICNQRKSNRPKVSQQTERPTKPATSRSW
jgi:5-methylcytosine-specific restriction endonuclease McrA